MNTKGIAEEYRLTHWSQVMHERRESGLSIKAYCKQQGFHENVYYYWQRKLREAACAEFAERSAGAETRLAPSGWTRLSAIEPETAASTLSIEINGCRVSVRVETDPELLAKVCRILRAL